MSASEGAGISRTFPRSNRGRHRRHSVEPHGGYADPVKAKEPTLAPVFSRRLAANSAHGQSRGGSCARAIASRASSWMAARVAENQVVMPRHGEDPRESAAATCRCARCASRTRGCVRCLPAAPCQRPPSQMASMPATTPARAKGRSSSARFPTEYHDVDPYKLKNQSRCRLHCRRAGGVERAARILGIDVIEAMRPLYDVSPDWFRSSGRRAGVAGGMRILQAARGPWL